MNAVIDFYLVFGKIICIMLTFALCSTNDSVLEEMKKAYMLQQVGEGSSNNA